MKKQSTFIVLGGPWTAAALRIRLFHGPPWRVTNDAAQPVERDALRESPELYTFFQRSQKFPLYPFVWGRKKHKEPLKWSLNGHLWILLTLKIVQD
jgi:hypothetical protein